MPHIIGVCVRVRVYKCRNTGLSGIRSVRYRKEKIDAGTSPVPDQAKAVRHFLIRYRTENIDAGMPMPELVFWMPSPAMHDDDDDVDHKPIVNFSVPFPSFINQISHSW